MHIFFENQGANSKTAGVRQRDHFHSTVNSWIVGRTGRSIADAIIKAAASPETTAALGRAARQDVQKYTEANFQARWRELLEEQSASGTRRSVNRR